MSFFFKICFIKPKICRRGKINCCRVIILQLISDILSTCRNRAAISVSVLITDSNGVLVLNNLVKRWMRAFFTVQSVGGCLRIVRVCSGLILHEITPLFVGSFTATVNPSLDSSSWARKSSRLGSVEN